MKYYTVNGIQFGLSYQFSDFLNNNIEKYEVDSCEVKHLIETKIVDFISVPSETPLMTINHREIYQNGDVEQVVVYDRGQPILMIEKDSKYRNMTLSIVKDVEGAPEIEYVYTGIMFMELCLYHSIQSIHGSAIVHNNKVIIFSGPSGTGKSTHVEYWKALSPTIQILNDDKPLLSLVDGLIKVSGSPWSGKTKQNINASHLLHSIVFLEQGKTNEVIELNLQEKVVNIMRNINRPRQDELWDKVSDVIEVLIKETPMYRASVTNDIEAARVVMKKLGV